ncbi:11237_t:CDS:2, partial [Gigaspora margarita]
LYYYVNNHIQQLNNHIRPYSATQQPYLATQLYMDSLTLNKTLFLPPSFTTSHNQENLSPFGPIAVDVESSTSSTSSNVFGSGCFLKNH